MSARLADHHAGAVVDEEARADRRAGVDVDAGLGVGQFGHHPRNERHAQAVQLVGDAIDRDRLQAGIAEDDFVVALGRRVAAKGGLHVLFEHLADLRQPPQQFDRLLLGRAPRSRRAGASSQQLVAQGPGDLRG